MQQEKGGETLPFIYISFFVARKKSDYRVLGHDSIDSKIMILGYESNSSNYYKYYSYYNS